MEKDFGFFCSQWELSYKRLSTAKCTSRVSNKWDFSLVIFTSIMSIFFHTLHVYFSRILSMCPICTVAPMWSSAQLTSSDHKPNLSPD